MAHILLIRFSALGDVVMTAPVVSSLAEQYPQHQITVLSRKRMAVYFQHLPENVTFRGVDLNDYKGLFGLHRLYRELTADGYDYIADLHDVLRTKVLRFFFWLRGIPVSHIEKGRDEKKALTREENKEKKQLKTSFQRYADVLKALGFPVTLEYHPMRMPRQAEDEGENWIGVAPFAAHQGKIYPLDKMQEVVRLLAENPMNKVFLFGGGKKEREILEKWEKEIPGAESVVGKLKQEEELELMNQLNVMVSMDSANMHIASLVGTPVVSIWGATHPFAGFMGWGQDTKNAMQLDLPCRPCSIYGNKPCLRGDYACLHLISPKDIIEKVQPFLK